jgi:tetratricopeptide (TPR) repeat protein
MVLVAMLMATACTGGPPRCPEEGGAVWREVVSEHFRLVTDLEAEVAESELDRFERAYDAMVQAAFPRGAQGRMRLVVFREDAELRAFVPNAVAGLFVEGWAMEDDETGTALFAGGLRAQSRAVFQHELAHRLLAAGFPEVPPWFSEGLATYFETMRVEGGRVILGDWARPYVPARVLPPVRRLTALDRDAFYLGASRRDVNDDVLRQVNVRYVASWHLVHLLRNGPDAIRREFRRVIEAINEGEPFEPAFRAFVEDVSAPALERAFRIHSEDAGRLSSAFAYTPSPVGTRPAARKLGNGETHLLWAKILLAGTAPQRALIEVDEALRHTRSLEARLARAHVLLVRGDVAGGTEAFTAIATEAPTNGAALAGLLQALLVTEAAAPAPSATERIGDLAARLAGIATTADEHTMAVVGLAVSGKKERALAASDAAVRAHPTSSRLLAARARLLAEAGRHGEATATLRRALQALPDRVARSEKGRALARRLAEYRAAAEREAGAVPSPPADQP